VDDDELEDLAVRAAVSNDLKSLFHLVLELVRRRARPFKSDEQSLGHDVASYLENKPSEIPGSLGLLSWA